MFIKKMRTFHNVDYREKKTKLIKQVVRHVLLKKKEKSFNIKKDESLFVINRFYNLSRILLLVGYDASTDNLPIFESCFICSTTTRCYRYNFFMEIFPQLKLEISYNKLTRRNVKMSFDFLILLAI